MAPPPSTGQVARLRDLIAELRDDYPELEGYVASRSRSQGGKGAGGGVPLNLEALIFLNEYYWLPGADHPPDEHTTAPPCVTWRGDQTASRCGRCQGCHEAAQVAACRSQYCGADPDNWRAGLKITVLGLERSVRNQMGFGPLVRRSDPRQRIDSRVLDALAWLDKSLETIVADHPMMAETLYVELSRIRARVRGMLFGIEVSSIGWSICPACGAETLVSDGDRAVCTALDCRRDDGSRNCWAVSDETGRWEIVDEPEGRRGRGKDFGDDQVADLLLEAAKARRATDGEAAAG